MHTLAGLILASGTSRRYGAENKLLVPLNGVPIIERTANAFAGAGLHEVVVVVGHEAPKVRDVLRHLPVRFVDNPEYGQGQSRALNRGLATLPPAIGAAVIGVGDQPLLTSAVVVSLVERFLTGQQWIAAPRYAGERGNPVVFSAALFPELRAVSGDQGGRSIVQRYQGRIDWLEVEDDGPAHDLDTPEDLAWIEQRLRSG